MSPQSLAFVGCRLLAVYVLLGVVQAQTSNLFFYLQSLDVSEYSGRAQGFDFDPYFQSALLNLCIFFVLWFRAGWISGKVAAGTPKPQGGEQAPWSRRSALSIVTIATGLWLLVLLVPALTYALQRLLQSGSVDPFSLVYIALTIAVALICILSPRGIADSIARLRRWR